ncbi:MAG: glycosyltransferase family 2 protein [Sphingomonas fennica]
MTRPAFAVVVPLHDKGRHIERALASVAAQTLAPAELIVIDDASTDDGPAIAAAFPGVRLLTRTEPGPGGYAARNAGIRAASTPWIAFLDADDAWAPDHLATLAALIAQEPAAAMVGSGYVEQHPGNRQVRDVYARRHPQAAPATFGFDAFVAEWLSIGECPVWTSAIAAPRETLLAVDGFPEGRCRRGGDKDLWLRLAHAGPVTIGTAATATYYKDSDNMVTARRHVNSCHCVVPTIDGWLPAAPPARRTLLKRLRNHETWLYALRTAKTDRVAYASWRGFSLRHDPLRFAALAVLSSPVGPLLGRLATRLRAGR